MREDGEVDESRLESEIRGVLIMAMATTDCYLWYKSV